MGVAPERRSGQSDTLRIAAICLLLPVAIFVTLRPDWYYVQNGLDPYFYTGYVQNLGDNLSTARDGYYFVSRWSVYLPGHYFFRLFGPQYGIVVLRWLYAALLTLGILRFGSRRWGLRGAATATTCILLSPMFLRGFFSEYSDAITLPFGILFLLLFLDGRRRWRSALLAGVAAGLCIVANVFAAVMIAIAALAIVATTRGWRARFNLVALLSVGGFGVLIAGLLYFRLRYGLTNIYRPSIDYVLNRSATSDLLKRRTLGWMGYFLWIYLPPFVCLVVFVARRKKLIELTHAEICIVWIALLQYCFQVGYQLFLGGSTLEISYYWVYGLPSFFLASSILVGRTVARVGPRTSFFIIGTLATGLFVTHKGPDLFGQWYIAGSVIGMCTLTAFIVARRTHAPIAAVAIIVPILVPLAFPRPVPTAAGEPNLQPHYESVFHSTSSLGQEYFWAVTWFGEQLRQLDTATRRSMYFWTGGGYSSQMQAAALAIVDGRIFNPLGGPVPDNAHENFFTSMKEGQVVNVALVGLSDDVRKMKAELSRRGIDFTILNEQMYRRSLETTASFIQVTRKR